MLRLMPPISHHPTWFQPDDYDDNDDDNDYDYNNDDDDDEELNLRADWSVSAQNKTCMSPPPFQPLHAS